MSVDPATHAPQIPQWTLGDRLRKVRRQIGLSQAAFAAKLDTNQKTYASWELDMTAPRNVVALARRVEILTEIPAAWLLGLADPTGPATRLAGAVTDAQTHWYRAPSSRRRGPLALVTTPGTPYRGVAPRNGSSRARCAKPVNDANAA